MNQRPARARRTVLSVPASSERFLDKSVGLDVDQATNLAVCRQALEARQAPA